MNEENMQKEIIIIKEVFDEEKRLNHKYHSLTTIKKKSITFNFDSEEEKRTFIINLLNM